MSRKKERCYVIVSKKDWRYGVFEYSKEGLKHAKRYLKEIQTDGGEELKIVVR